MEKQEIKISNNKSEEKRKRQDIVMILLIGSLLGFLVNIYSNIAFEVFFNNQPFDKFNNIFFQRSIFGFYILIRFLIFYIEDYLNKGSLDLFFIGRFLKYLDQVPEIKYTRIFSFRVMFVAVSMLISFIIISIVGGLFGGWWSIPALIIIIIEFIINKKIKNLWNRIK